MRLFQGLFVTFEGIEGCGKSTQVRRLVAYLEGLGFSVVATREPGGTLIGEQIRSILGDVANKDMDPLTEALLFAASRRQHVQQLIKPSLDAGKIVVCDRYADSSIAYQAYGRGLSRTEVTELQVQCTWGCPKPDLTFMLDIPPLLAAERLQERYHDEGGENDRFELMDEIFFGKVREGFRELADKEPQRWRVLDGTMSEDEVHEEILLHLQPALKKCYLKVTDLLGYSGGD